MKNTANITTITIYWDASDPSHEGWAKRWKRNGIDESDDISIDGSASLDDAIDQACHELDVPLDHNDFARDPNQDGGWAFWSCEESE